MALNNLGDVVGTYFTTEYDSEYHSFLFHDGQMVDLFPGEFTYPMGINDAGTITGMGLPNNRPYYGWTYTLGGQRKAIPPLSGDHSTPHAITQQGTVVGASGNVQHPYTYDAAGIHDLGLPAGANGADGSDVNARGDVVGLATKGGLNYAVLYSNGSWRYLSEAYSDGWALSINDAGVAVGYVRTSPTNTRAFRYVNGTLKLLENFDNAWATDINNAGMMVGAYNLDSTPFPFIDDGTESTNVNNLLESGTGWRIRWASKINDLDQIAGWGIDPDGQERAVLLVPIPEPTCLAVTFVGVVIGGTLRRWRI